MAKNKADNVEKEELDKTNKKLDDLISTMNKKFGKETVKWNPNEVAKIPRWKLESPIISYILGGGIPKGRIIELYGPESSGKTSIATFMAAQVQKSNDKVAIIDAENSFDLEYAQTLGLNVKDLLFTQPTSGEDALEIAKDMAESGVVKFIMVDSVAALTPVAELEGEMADQQMGLQARLMSKACRKLANPLQVNQCTIVFINQIREKIGVMFGCNHADNVIVFEDGKNIPIKKVVDEQIKGNVLSYNESSDSFEYKEIIDWHNNGVVKDNKDFTYVETSAIGTSNGKWGLVLTPDHKVLSNAGWKKVKDLKVGENIATKYESIMNGTLKDFIVGTSIGDSCISVKGNSACIRIQDSKNSEYLEWKKNKLSSALNFKEINSKRIKYNSEWRYDLKVYKNKLENRNPACVIDDLTDMGLAVWFMDDAYYDNTNSHNRYILSVKRLKKDQVSLNIISDYFKKEGYNFNLTKNGEFRFDVNSTELIAEKICKYIPNSMQYKLPQKYRGKYEEFVLNYKPESKMGFVMINVIREASKRQMRKKGKYDITVKDNENYFVGGQNNGVIVHNSPETTPGGRALKFFTSVRVEVRRVDSITQKQEVIGLKSRIKSVKNKTAPPYRKGEFEILFGKGIQFHKEYVDFAVKYNIIEKSASWFSLKDDAGKEIEKIQGAENVVDYLQNNKEYYESLKNKVNSAMNTPVVDSEAPVINMSDAIEEIK